MCTAATFRSKDFYFGRTLDYEFSYGDEVTVTPRGYALHFRHAAPLHTHYAVIGMAHVLQNYPLYYDAMNEKGLCMAGLNFVGNAVYRPAAEGKDNVAQFELIPWLLGQCASVQEVKARLQNLNITDDAFLPQLPTAQLHWLIADRTEAITVEAVRDGLRVYPNPVGVLTNNPPFDMQMFHLNNYRHLSAQTPPNTFAPDLPLQDYCRGLGGLGLPGDLSSQSRFVRVAFTKLHAVCGESEAESVSQFFHIMGAVDQQRGCDELDAGKYEITLYTSCCNARTGVYYYTCYNNHQITAVDMHKEDLDGAELARYPLIEEEQIRYQN